MLIWIISLHSSASFWSFSDPRFSRSQNSLRPVGHLQFAEDIRDMVAHCLQAEHQLFGDLLIRAALSDEFKNFSFAICQFRENSWRDRRP
jgi:hypothetical protein